MQQATGRPRRYCSDRCRKRGERAKASRKGFVTEGGVGYPRDEEARLAGLEMLAAFRRRRTAR